MSRHIRRIRLPCSSDEQWLRERSALRLCEQHLRRSWWPADRVANYASSDRTRRGASDARQYAHLCRREKRRVAAADVAPILVAPVDDGKRNTNADRRSYDYSSCYADNDRADAGGVVFGRPLSAASDSESEHKSDQPERPPRSRCDTNRILEPAARGRKAADRRVAADRDHQQTLRAAVPTRCVRRRFLSERS